MCSDTDTGACLCFLMKVFLNPTGLEGGALRGHAPGAGAPAFGQHDGEFVQSVGLQTRHDVAQAGGVGHLVGDREKQGVSTLFLQERF